MLSFGGIGGGGDTRQVIVGTEANDRPRTLKINVVPAGSDGSGEGLAGAIAVLGLFLLELDFEAGALLGVGHLRHAEIAGCTGTCWNVRL